MARRGVLGGRSQRRSAKSEPVAIAPTTNASDREQTPEEQSSAKAEVRSTSPKDVLQADKDASVGRARQHATSAPRRLVPATRPYLGKYNSFVELVSRSGAGWVLLFAAAFILTLILGWQDQQRNIYATITAVTILAGISSFTLVPNRRAFVASLIYSLTAVPVGVLIAWSTVGNLEPLPVWEYVSLSLFAVVLYWLYLSIRWVATLFSAAKSEPNYGAKGSLVTTLSLVIGLSLWVFLLALRLFAMLVPASPGEIKGPMTTLFVDTSNLLKQSAFLGHAPVGFVILAALTFIALSWLSDPPPRIRLHQAQEQLSVSIGGRASTVLGPPFQAMLIMWGGLTHLAKAALAFVEEFLTFWLLRLMFTAIGLLFGPALLTLSAYLIALDFKLLNPGSFSGVPAPLSSLLIFLVFHVALFLVAPIYAMSTASLALTMRGSSPRELLRGVAEDIEHQCKDPFDAISNSLVVACLAIPVVPLAMLVVNGVHLGFFSWSYTAILAALLIYQARRTYRRTKA